MSLTHICVRRPVFVAMVMVGLAGIGAFCYKQMARELFPEIEFPMITIVTRYQGAGPREVEQLITRELEDEISTVEGIKHLHGQSQQGLSLLMAEFYLETDIDVAAADVREKVNLVRGMLPEEADDPIVQKIDFNAEPVAQLAISADRPAREVYEMADRMIRDRISTVPGVASVTIVGGQEREIHVLTSQQRLRAMGLSITDVIGTVAAANIESPGGQIQQNSREYTIRLQGKFSSLEEIETLRIPVGMDGRSIYLRDIAEVKDAYKDIRDMVRADGRPCVGMSVQKRDDGNTVEVVELVRQQIEQLDKVLPEDYEITIQDEQATWIVSSIENVFSNMRIGIILTAIALFVFLHSFRSMLIISMTMPIAVAATFIAMFGGGFTINLMSMMGLAMTIGVLVNNAILVIENIVRYIDLGHDPATAAVEGTNEIAIAVSSTTLTNIVVFVPIAFMGGIIGQFFRDFGLTATMATILSLFISFTLAPMMASKLLSRVTPEAKERRQRNGFYRRLDHFAASFDGALERTKHRYAGMLNTCLKHRWIVLIITIVVFLGSLSLVMFIGGEFITPMDQGKFSITVEMPTGTRLETTDNAVRRIEGVLNDDDSLPELVSLYTTVGRSQGANIGGASEAVNIAEILVTIVPKEERDQSTEAIMDRLRPELAAANIPGANIKMLESGGEGGEGAPIQLEVTSDNMEQLKAFATEAAAMMSDPEQLPGAIDVDTNYRVGRPEIKIVPDRQRCRDAGVDVQYLARVIPASFDGWVTSEYRDGAYNYDIRVRNDKQSRKTIADVQQLTVMNRQGDRIPLPQLAIITEMTGPSQLFRKDRQNLITVSCAASGISIGDLAAKIREQLQPLLKKYPDCRIFFGGEIENMRDSFSRLGVALIMAVCLTYMLLASLLESFTQPIIIMITLPLSLIGVLLALFLMGGTFSIFSIMSIIMLVGLVINNAIIVIDYINIMRREGKDRREAILESGRTRLRPILMANLTTVVALIPLAMGRGWGGEMMAPMAMVQIGGLVAGGWLGLLIVPVIYTMSDDFNHWVLRLIGKETKQ